LSKGHYYTSYEEVAAYWTGFGELPVNYVCADGDDSSSCKDTKNKYFPTYGEDTRCWFTYHRTSGYMTQVPEYNGTIPTYFECDISSNWGSYQSNRGAYRLVALPDGVKNYGTDPVIFYTADHYDTFTEYYNRDGGWWQSFAGRGDYLEPETVNPVY
jgi:ribonuclease.